MSLNQEDRPAPAQDEREVAGVERYRVESTGRGFWPFCVRAGDGARELFVGQRKACERVAAELATAFEDGKFVARRPAQTELTGKCIVEVVSGREGPSLYIGDGDTGHRLAGNKPWGGGSTLHTFTVDIAELVREATGLAAQPEPEEDDSPNLEPEGSNTYLVVDPDDNYHVCYVVRSKGQALQHASGGLLAFGPITQE